MPEKFPYNLEKAQEEAAKMRAKIESGEVKDYNEAEKAVEERNKIDEVLKKLKEKYKIEKYLPDQVEDQLQKISEIFNGINNVKGRKILDLGCGSNYGSYDIAGAKSRLGYVKKFNRQT